MRTLTLVVPMVALMAVAGCGRDAAPAKPIVTAAQLDKQAIDAATATERRYQSALAKGDLAFLGECRPGSPESIRLVDIAGEGARGYSLAITADAHGAVAIWQGLQHVGGGKYQAYGPQGMRLDGNGWRQLQQMLMELHLDEVRPGGDGIAPKRAPGGGPFFAYCLDGQAHLGTRAQRVVDDSGAEQLAVRMRRLAGNYYSPPARGDE